jgi:hypothetical protein
MEEDFLKHSTVDEKSINESRRLHIEYTEKLLNIELSLLSFASKNLVEPYLISIENNQKSIDVVVDILKFLIPINFTLLITSYSLPILSSASTWSLLTLLSLILFLLKLIDRRNKLTDKYIAFLRSCSDLYINYFTEKSYENTEAILDVSTALLNWRLKASKVLEKLNNEINNFRK